MEHPISHHQSDSWLFVKARYKGLLKNDNQLAMLFTLANLFQTDQNDTSVGEISLKLGITPLNGEETV